MTEYNWRAKSFAEGTAVMARQQLVSKFIRERFRVYFPTKDTILQSRGGPGVG